MSETATLKIWRGQNKAQGHWETHAVPFERGQSVLDGLRWIRAPGSVIRSSTLKATARAAVSTVGWAVAPRQKAARAQFGIAVVRSPCAT